MKKSRSIKKGKNEGKPTAVVLCAGAGGSTEGLKQAGFNVVAVVDNWDIACDNHELNHPGVKVIRGDISKNDTKEEVLDLFKGRPPDLAFITAPCQDDSLANKNRDPGSDRADVLWHCMDLAERLGAAVIVSEHVRGFMSAKCGDGFPRRCRLAKDAADSGRKTDFIELCAADYGVPQIRNRVFAVCTRFEVDFEPPEPTHGEGRKKPWITVADAIGDLAGREEDEALSHLFTKHGESVQKMIDGSEPGGSVGENRWRMRLHPDRPSPTIRASDGDLPVHYSENRAISPREAARLQGILDSILFDAPKTETHRLIGNAVPPPLAEAVGFGIIGMLRAIAEGAPEVTDEDLDDRLSSMNAHPSLTREDLTKEQEGLRKATVEAFVSKNARREKVKAKAEGIGLEMGGDIERFFKAVNGDGRRYSDNSIYKLLEEHPAYTLRKGMIREYHLWWKDRQAVADETGEEPPKLNVSMWEVVRDYKAQTLDPFEKLDVLRDAEATGLSVRGLREAIGKRKSEAKPKTRKAKPKPDFAKELLDYLKMVAREARKLINKIHEQQAVVPEARMDSVNEVLRIAQKGSQEVVRTPGERAAAVPVPSVVSVEEIKEAA